MQLEVKHLNWIFSAAHEYYADRIKELEQELVAHEALKDLTDELYVSGSILSKSRQQRIDEIREYLHQYRTIVLFCREARMKCVDKSAEEFAKAFKFFKQQ